MTRYRSRPGAVYTGRYRFDADGNPYGITESGAITVHEPPDESWDDVHEPPFAEKAGDLRLHSWKSKPARFNMPTTQYPRELRQVTNVPLLPSGAGPLVWEAGWEAMQTHAIASIQDSEPITDVITDTAETISDIPRLGQGLLGILASEYLTYHWAIKPMLENLEQMMNLQNEVAQRLSRHRKKSRLKRWRGSGKGIAILTSTGSSQSNQTVNGRQTVRCDQSASLTRNEAWWVAKLEVRDDFSVPDFLTEQRSVGFQTGITDMGAYLRALWELVPWSFLIDYFASVSSVVKYHTNRVVYDVPLICLMATYEVERTIKPVYWNSSGGQENWGNVSAGYTRQLVKRRKVVYSPGVWIGVEPVLSGQQISNLVALATAMLDLGRKIRR